MLLDRFVRSDDFHRLNHDRKSGVTRESKLSRVLSRASSDDVQTITSTCFFYPCLCNACAGCPKSQGKTRIYISVPASLPLSELSSRPFSRYCSQPMLSTMPVFLVQIRLRLRASVALVYTDTGSALNPQATNSYIYMEHLFLMFLDHTQRRSTVGRTPLDE